MGYILKRRQSKKKIKQRRTRSALGWVTAENRMTEDKVHQHQSGSALGWVTTGRGDNRDSRRRSPGEPCQVGTWMGDHLKRRQSKEKVKQHRSRSAVGWVTARKRDSRR